MHRTMEKTDQIKAVPAFTHAGHVELCIPQEHTKPHSACKRYCFLFANSAHRPVGFQGLQNENCHLDAGRHPAGRTCEPQVKAVQLLPAPWGESLKPRQDTWALLQPEGQSLEPPVSDSKLRTYWKDQCLCSPGAHPAPRTSPATSAMSCVTGTLSSSHRTRLPPSCAPMDMCARS